MKSKIILILMLLLSMGVFPQVTSVPNTNTFNLQNVVDVVNPTTDDLGDAFNDSNAEYFNLFHGSKTMNPKTLYGFRDYGPQNGACPSIGDYHEGGIVAYILRPTDPGYVAGECHGIIAAPSDQATSIAWGTNYNTVVTSSSTGSSTDNTANIIAVNGAGSYAAKLCDDLVLNGKSDWVLPSLNELTILCINKSLIGGFGSDIYWSSSQIVSGSTRAYIMTFDQTDCNVIGTAEKLVTGIRVRAIRYFYTVTSPPATAPEMASTTAVTNIATTTATSGGNVTYDGGSTILERGICWSNSTSTPTTSNSKATYTAGTGSYSVNMSGLSSSTGYYVRAYASNAVGTTYGTAVYFTTSTPATAPVMAATNAVTNISFTTATSGGNVTSDGGSTILTRGICWSNVTSMPTISHYSASYTAGTGAYSVNMTGLGSSTGYYVRAYASNAVGITYGTAVYFTTSTPIYPPSVTTNFASSGGYSYYVLSGNVTAENGATVTARGVFYGTSSVPGTGLTIGSGLGSFSGNTPGLSPGTKYYYRAWAYNSAGYGYGSTYSFDTPTAPTVTTPVVHSIAQTTATAGGNITASGGQTPHAAGVCYSTSSNPTTANSKVTTSTTSGAFTSYLTGLTGNTTYYVRAYATNYFGGTSYGNQQSFTTTTGTINAALTVVTQAVDANTRTLRFRVTTVSNVPSTQAFNITHAYSGSQYGPTSSTITITAGTNTQYFDYQFPRAGGWTLTTNWNGAAPAGYTYTTGPIAVVM